jgi:hypothetical protein
MACTLEMKFFIGFSRSQVMRSAHRNEKAPIPAPHHLRYRSGSGMSLVYFRIWCEVMTDRRVIPPKMRGTSK